MKTLHHTAEEVCISEHPAFHEKRSDWGVIETHWSPVYDDEGYEIEREWIPENRRKYRPELDGMSLADMWDDEKNDWRIQPPGFEGITRFMRPKITWATETFPESVWKIYPEEKL